MKQCIFTFFLFITVNYLFGQRPETDQLRTLAKLDLGLQGVGFTLEPKLGNNSTIDISAGIGGGYDILINEFTYVLDITNPALYFSVTPKFFYNRQKRAANGKKNSLNAGNFVGLRLRYNTKGIAENGDIYDALLMNIHWGLQRPLGKKWVFATHVGAGYAMDATDLNESSGTIYPALEFRFSYVFSKPAGKK